MLRLAERHMTPRKNAAATVASGVLSPTTKDDGAPTTPPPTAEQTPDRVDTDLLELGNRRIVHPQRVAVSRRGMVATAHHRASEAGAEMLADEGNAVDAAVAAAFALGVCEPAASGLGGQTTMLVHLSAARRTFALDGSSRAPNRTDAAALTRASRLRGYCATTVPSRAMTSVEILFMGRSSGTTMNDPVSFYSSRPRPAVPRGTGRAPVRPIRP